MIKADVFVVGAGMAGLTLAHELSQAGMSVCVAEKARGSGGRLSSKRIELGGDAIGFDLGALSFTAKTKGFKRAVSNWQQLGVIEPWLAVEGETHFVGTPRSSSVTRHLANQLDVHFSTRVHSVIRKGEHWQILVEGQQGATEFAQARHVVYASPAEQTLNLLPNQHKLQSLIQPVRIHSQWAMMLALPTPLPISDLMLNVTKKIQSISYENSKPSRHYPSDLHVYCLQASAEFSKACIDDDPDWIKGELIRDLESHINATLNLTTCFIHRWLYAQGSVHGHIDAGCLASEDGISVCGDYLLGNMNVCGVEAAYLSGLALAHHLKNANSVLSRVG